MRGGLDRGRRRALGLVACAALVPQSVLAQDPRAAAAQRAAREWLALVDTLDPGASWKAAGERFQETMPLAIWVRTLQRDREPRGALIQRAIAATGFTNSAANLPEGGSFAVVRFRSTFVNGIASLEEVTLEVGPDYAWHVIGYVIQ